MNEPVLLPVWRMNNVAAERDVLAFWREAKLLSQDVDIVTRLKELCLIAYDGDKVVGVNTAVITRIEQVRAKIAMLRFAVAADYRQMGLTVRLLEMAHDMLERWAKACPEECVMGTGFVLQTRMIPPEQTKQAVWHGHALIDHTPAGDQIRIGWFEGARID